MSSSSAKTTVRPGWRLRAIRRKMSIETFHRTIPFRAGWKREYYGGRAYVRPSWTRATFEVDIAPRTEVRDRGLRPLRDADREELLSAFIDSFRCAPEHADYPIRKYRERAAKYVEGFYGDVRGSRSPASTVIVRDGQIVAAALIKNREAKPPLLDCLLVRPAYFRQGLATAVATRAANELARTGAAVLRSSAMLANEASIAWHLAFGFRELPDALVAQARFYEASGERDRLDGLGKLAPAERERLTALAEYWWKEVIRLNSLPLQQRHPGLDDRNAEPVHGSLLQHPPRPPPA